MSVNLVTEFGHQQHSRPALTTHDLAQGDDDWDTHHQQQQDVRGGALSSSAAASLVGQQQRDSDIPTFAFRAHHHPIRDVQVSKGGLIFTASIDSTIKVFRQEENNASCLKTFYQHSNVVSEIALSSDETHFVSSSYDKTCMLMDLNKAAKPTMFVGHSNAVLSVAMSPDNRVVCSGGADNSVIVWNVEGKKKFEDKKHTGFVNRVMFNPSFSSILVSVSEDKTMNGYTFKDQINFMPFCHVTGPSKPILNFDISPDGSLCALVTKDKIYYSDMVVGDHCGSEKLEMTSKEVQMLKRKRKGSSSVSTDASCIKFNPHDVLMAYNMGPSLHLYNLCTKKRKVIHINDDAVDANHFSSAVFTRFNWDSTGMHLITGASDGFVRIYDCSSLMMSMGGGNDVE